ncbi:MAG: cytochrome c [Novosphingobium sp.]
MNDRIIAQGAAIVAIVGIMTLTGEAVKAAGGGGEASAAMTSATSAAPVDPAEAEGIIFERQQAMLQLERDADKLGDIIAGLAPRAKLGETARAIANGAKDAEESFALHVPGGRSKPEVWSNREDYDRRMQEFVQKSDAMATMAEADNLNGVIETLNDAMPCKACHDVYRAPKRPSQSQNRQDPK